MMEPKANIVEVECRRRRRLLFRGLFMLLSTKSWNTGASAPAGWTAIEVEEVFARESVKIVDNQASLDGTNSSAKRVYVAVDIRFHKEYDATQRAAINAFVQKDFQRIFDGRYAFYKKDGTAVALDTNNVVDFVVESVDVSRSGSSRVLETMLVKLISKNPLG